MALFEFILHPLQKVMPWGEAPNLMLHWFGLTDGIYYMNVGEDQLFRAPKEILEQWRKEYPNAYNFEYVDYPVIRLYEDLLEILTNILQPIPTKLHHCVAFQPYYEYWEEKLWDVFHSTENEEIEELYYLAREWWNCRTLSTLHLKHGQDIWLWRWEETVYIRWHSKLVNGIQPWTTMQGNYQLPVDKFKKEVESFHNRLMDEMTQRIEQIKINNPIPHIKIDVPSLEKEHEDRKKSLGIALSKVPDVQDWNKVMEALNQLLGNSVNIFT